MKKGIFLSALAFLTTFQAIAQDTLLIRTDTVVAGVTEPVTTPTRPAHVYTMKPAVDVPIIAIGTGWSIYAFTKIYSKDPSTPEQIMNLDENDIPKFDRWAAGMSNEDADRISDYPFYGSMVLPFFLLLDKDIREDAPRIGLLFWEAMSITGIFYTGGVYFVDRYRPATYDESIPIEEGSRATA